MRRLFKLYLVETFSIGTDWRLFQAVFGGVFSSYARRRLFPIVVGRDIFQLHLAEVSSS
jgi:hypothetical protein